jgi:glycosyltransferase involved in cell wall biosynthesis
MKISAFIIALNEVDRIAATIKSLHFCDEIIVIDSGSTDGTQALAESLGARIVFNKWPGYGEQKRFGEMQCSHDWLLNLDADEIITPALEAEIKALKFDITGYELGFQDAYPGEIKPAFLTYVKRFIRLYDRRFARFSDSPVHDTVDVYEGKITRLKNPALHFSTRSYAHAIEKMNKYTDSQAQNIINKGKKISSLRFFTVIPFLFFKSYILRRNIFRGKTGFMYAVFYAFAHFTKIAKVVEQKKLQ